MFRTWSLVTIPFKLVELSRTLDTLTLSVGFLICKMRIIHPGIFVRAKRLGLPHKKTKVTVSSVLDPFYLERFFR